MNIEEAIASRHSVRQFLDKSVSRELLEDLLQKALRAPSGGNLQPWWLHVVSGDPLKELQERVANKIRGGVMAEDVEYDIYPREMVSPYRERRYQVGEDMYARLGIDREDRAGRQEWFLRNFACFGAPVLLFCSVDRRMGKPQWSDLGMLLQSLMLLLKGHGLDSCPQEAWALYPQTVGEFLELPDEQMLFTGMSIGYADTEHPVNQVRTRRASTDEVVRFFGM